MKRAKGLWSEACTLENVLLAFEKASRGKRERPDVIAYEKNLLHELARLLDQLEMEHLLVGNYAFFKIHDPKERLICAAPFRERVLHHALMNVCEPVFERFLFDHTYACRPGKGTQAAIRYARGKVRGYAWFAKMDIRHYFETLPHAPLKRRLARLIGDREMLNLLGQVMDSYDLGKGRGLPIGNLTSQHFANVYLGYLDRFVKEGLGIRPYVRYMDDFIIWGRSREEVAAAVSRIETFVTETLELALKPVEINRTRHGMDFLGFRLFPNRTRLTAKNKRRFIRKSHEFNSDKGLETFGEEGIIRRQLALNAWIEQADTRGLRRETYRRINGWYDDF